MSVSVGVPLKREETPAGVDAVATTLAWGKWSSVGFRHLGRVRQAVAFVESEPLLARRHRNDWGSSSSSLH